MFDNRLAFVLADEKVNGELATLRVAVARHMPPDSAAGVLHILAGLPSIFLRALDRSAPETGYSSPEDLAESQGWRPGEVHRIRMGRSLPDGWLAIHPDKDGDIGEGTIHATEAEASSALALEAPRE